MNSEFESAVVAAAATAVEDVDVERREEGGEVFLEDGFVFPFCAFRFLLLEDSVVVAVAIMILAMVLV